MKVELPKNWKLLAGLPLSEELDRQLMRKIEDFILQTDNDTLSGIEKMVNARWKQIEAEDRKLK